MLLAWLSFLAAVPQSPDLTLTWVRSGGGVSEATITVSISGKRVRVESTAKRAPVLLWDGDQKQLVLLRPRDPSSQRQTSDVFTRVDEAGAKRARAQRNPEYDEARRAIEQSATRLSPERQAQLKAGLDSITEPTGERGPTTFTAKKERATVGRWACERYRARQGVLERDVCVVPWKQAAVTRAELEPLRGLAAFLVVLNGPPAVDDVLQPPAPESPGLPVKTVIPVNGDAITVELRGASHGALSAEQF